MKIYYVFIILSLILSINNTDFCDLTVSATGPNGCKNLIKASYVNYCCFFKGKWKGQDYNGNCMDITPVRYKEMKEYISELNKLDNYDIEKIDCKSNYFKINILFLVFIIFELFSKLY